MKKKKLFIYMHQCILKGGVEKVFFNLLNNLPKERYDVTVLSYMAYLTDDIYAGLYPDNVHRRWLYYDEFASGGLRRLTQRVHNFLMPRLYPLWLRFRRFDTAIAAQEGMYAKLVDEKVRADRKLLWIHNDVSICHWTQEMFHSLQAEKACYERFDRVICVSQSVADSMKAVFGQMDNLCVCYNPIDTAEIDRKKNAFPVEREPIPLFVAVGRLADQKGFDRLLRVCSRLNAEGFDYRVWIIGDGEDREKLEQQRQDSGLKNVQFLGKKANVFPYMQAADWLICTSRHEGFNTALQEATWCGVPILSVENAGTNELLEYGRYGIVVPNDEDAVYEAMRRVLLQPELQEKYRLAIHERKAFIDLQERIAEICKLL